MFKNIILSTFIFFSFVFSSQWFFFKHIDFQDLIDDLLGYQVIYIGEIHTSKEIHDIQLEIIKRLYEKNKKLIIAMEAFQQPFQEALDLYVEGEISEEEMLERTEYKKRWRVDTKFYSPIWRFAEKHGIKILALNIPDELRKEIRERGLEKVKSPLLPPKVIYPPEEYEKFLRESLERHNREISWKRFLDVQTAWDNGMAYRLLKVLLLYPDHKIVVIVGKGHLYKGYGIPYVLKTLYPGVKQAILYPDEENRFYFLFSRDFSKEYSSVNSIKLPN